MVLGKIDWFGGFNSKTGKVNDFGFIKPVEEANREGIYVSRWDVPAEFRDFLEPGTYVEFEVTEDHAGKRRAFDIKMISLLGVFHKYKNGRGCITYDKKNSNIRVETLESLQSDDIVSFYLGYNSKLRKDKAVLVQKINKSTNDKALIEKCVRSNQYSVYKPFIVRYLASLSVDEAVEFVLKKASALAESDKQRTVDDLVSEADYLFLVSPELRSLLVENGDISHGHSKVSKYCQFVDKHILLADSSVNQELLDELLNRLEKASSSIQNEYWNELEFLRENLEYRGNLWDYAPEEVKINTIRKRYFRFFDYIYKFDASNYPFSQSLSYSWIELYDFDDLDKNLAEEWCSIKPSEPNEKARMLSARGAEKLVFKFFGDMQYVSEDIAACQITQKTDVWKKADVRLDSKILLDVKNARTSLNSKTYSEFCVPRFKQNRGSDVYIVAVLSPYLQYEFMNKQVEPRFRVEDPLILGIFEKKSLSFLEKAFNDNTLSLDLSRGIKPNKYLPPWLFDYNTRFYSNQNEVKAELLQLADADIPEWEEVVAVGSSPLPLFIAAKRKIPDTWVNHLPEWKVHFANLLINLSARNISLRHVFLALLKHFLEMLSHEDLTYSPQKYFQMLFTGSSKRHPLKLYDPLNIVKDFCDTLQVLWDFRQAENLTSFKVFKFDGKGLLQGKKCKTDEWTTIIAYCGGWVEKKGKCGYEPLVIGKHQSCSICGRLICPKEDCQFCEEGCEGHKRRLQKK